MIRCQNCKAENGEKDVYCAQCGFPLHQFPASKTVIGTSNGVYPLPSSDELPPAPPPSIAHSTPNGFFDYHQPINEYSNVYQQREDKAAPTTYTTLWQGAGPQASWNSHNMAAQEKPRRMRSLLEYVLDSLFSVWGVLWMGIGLLGFLEDLNPKDSALQNRAVGFMILYVVLGIFIVIVVLIRHKYPHLRWWHNLLGQGGALVAGVLIIIIGAAYLTIVTGSSNFDTPGPFDLIMGTACMCYGIASTFFALW